MKWVAYAIVVTIASLTLHTVGIHIDDWQYWVIVVGCLVASWTIGRIAGLDD